MRIVEIASLENGAHRNQIGTFASVPDGWAVIPSGTDAVNFPFGELTVEHIDGVPTVTSWTPGNLPESEITEDEPTTEELLNAMLGVNRYE